jgi:hypothetical protein
VKGSAAIAGEELDKLIYVRALLVQGRGDGAQEGRGSTRIEMDSDRHCNLQRLRILVVLFDLTVCASRESGGWLWPCAQHLEHH